MMDMKRAIAQRMTKEQAEARLAAMTTPAQVKDKIERVRADLLAVVNGKATRQGTVTAQPCGARRRDRFPVWQRSAPPSTGRPRRATWRS